MCFAVQLAADYATDSVYADGWQGTTTDNTTGVVQSAGDNGGFGFEPWNFDTDWLFNPDPPDGIQAIDDGLKAGTANSSTFNDIGKAWRMANPGTGLPRAGRGFAPLQVGQTVRIVFDNPTRRQFFKGYFIRFNSRNGDTSGGGNICYDYPGYSTACTAADLNDNGNNVPLGATPEPKLSLARFEYFDYGQWVVNDGIDSNPGTPQYDGHYIPLIDMDTAAGGAQLDLTITGPDEYELTLDPFGPATPYTHTGTLATPGEPIDWLEFTFFNPTTSTTQATDLYIKSIEIIGTVPPGVPGDFNSDGKVDAADYVIWRKNTGNNALPNDDGLTTQAARFDLWRSNFGEMAGGGSGAGGGAVPEPGSIALFTSILAGWLPWSRRTRKS
jgi:hypothetical protein